MNSSIMEKIIAALSVLVLSAAILIIVAGIVAWPIMFLWNSCLVGAITGINAIGFWQAFGLLILSSMLFKGIGSSKS